MEALSDALRIELRETGIGVSIVEPGPIKSKFKKHAIEKAETHLKGKKSRFEDVYQNQMMKWESDEGAERMFTLPPESVGKKVLHALESVRPQTRYPVTFPAYMGSFLRRFAPDQFLDYFMWSRWKDRASR